MTRIYDIITRRIVDDITTGNLQARATVLSQVYFPFYEKLAISYPNTKKGTGKLVVEQRKRILKVMAPLAKASRAGGPPITLTEYKSLAKDLRKLYEIHAHIVQQVSEVAPHREDLESALGALGTRTDIRGMTETLKKTQGMRRRPGGITQLTRTLGIPRIRSLGVLGALHQTIGLAGPLAAPLMGLGIVGGIGWKAAKWARGRAERRREKALLGGAAGAPGAAGLPGLPGLAGAGVMEGVASTYPRDPLGRFTPRGGLTGIDNVEKALFKFFNVRAMKAKWTRNMLRAAEGKGKPSGVMGGLLGSFKELGVLLPGILVTFGKFAGLAGAIAFTTYELHKMGKTAIEWWEVHKEVTESVKKQKELQLGFMEKLSTTLAEKMQTAKEEGDEPARKSALLALMEEQKKIQEMRDKPGLWQTFKSGARGIVSDVKQAVGIEAFEEGAVVTKPTIGLLGEKNKPEVVTPLSSGNILELLKAIKENTARAMGMSPGPSDTFRPPFDLADPILNQLNSTGSLSLG